MTADEAIAKLVAIRRKWRNNGSTIEFNKAEGEVYKEYSKNGGDWLDNWSLIQQEAHKQIK